MPRTPWTPLTGKWLRWLLRGVGVVLVFLGVLMALPLFLPYWTTPNRPLVVIVAAVAIGGGGVLVFKR